MQTTGVRKRLLEVDDMINTYQEAPPIIFNVEIPQIAEEESDKEEEEVAKPR